MSYVNRLLLKHPPKTNSPFASVLGPSTVASINNSPKKHKEQSRWPAANEFKTTGWPASSQSSQRRGPISFVPLLASFTIRIVNAALLHFRLPINRDIRGRTGVFHPARLQSILVDIHRRFLDLGRPEGSQVVGRLQPGLPGQTVHLVKLASTGMPR